MTIAKVAHKYHDIIPNYVKIDGEWSPTRLYRTWMGMKDRCYNPKSASYNRYGAVGIGICAEWISDYYSFSKWSVKNGYSDELTIDRINNSFGYSPENCRWATYKQQSANSKRVKMFTIGNETLCIADWCRKIGISHTTYSERVRKGWTDEKALTTPAWETRRKHE